MKIAYLILAHHQSAHLRRLISALDYADGHFFVHVDLKSDFSRFAGLEKSNVTVLQKRINVYRAGFSQITAMLSLVEAALQLHAFDYYIFLSGVDYPIKDNRYIHEFLMQHRGVNFINFYPLTGDAAGIHHLTKYHLVDLVAGLPGPLALLMRLMLRVVNLILPDRKIMSGMVPFRGSTSWCLQHDTVVYLRRFLCSGEGRALLMFFRYGWSPDEMLFPTVVLNSPFAEQCRYYERDIKNAKEILRTENKAYLHYIDWSAGRENPTVLNMTDFEALQKSERLFARKFDEEKSRELLDRIDEMLLKRRI